MNKYILVHFYVMELVHNQRLLGEIVWSMSTLFNALNKKVPLSVVVPRDFFQ